MLLHPSPEYQRLNPQFQLADVVAQRQSRTKEMIACMYHFAPALIGSVRWKNGSTMDDFSALVTVSDEVTLYIVLENNWEKWQYIFKHNVSTRLFVTLCFNAMITHFHSFVFCARASLLK